MELRRFSEDHPIIVAVVAIVLASLFTEIPLQRLFAPLVGEAYAAYVPGMIEQYLATIGVILLAGLAGLREPGQGGIGLGGRFGFAAPRSWKTAALGWPLLVFSLINASDALEGKVAIEVATPLTLVLLLLYLSTGFLEEGLFRGLILGLCLRWGKERRGIYAAVLLASLLFALAHILNLLQRRYTPLASLTQIGFAFFFGVFFSAIALRTGSLLPGVILHAVVDFAGNLQALSPGALPRSETLVSKTPSEALVAIAVTFPLLVYGLFILRKVGAPVATVHNKGKTAWSSCRGRTPPTD